MARGFIESCYKRTNDYRYKNILTAMKKLLNREKENPCKSCNSTGCMFRVGVNK